MNDSLSGDQNILDETIFLNYNKKLMVALSVLMVLVATFTVLANGTVAVAMIRTQVREMRRGAQSMPSSGGNSCVTRPLMLSMAFSGVLAGGFTMPLSVNIFISNGNYKLAYDLCVAHTYIDYLQCFSMNLHSLFMAVDTYMMVRHPLVHRSLTAKTGYCLVTIAWTLPTLLVALWGILQTDKLDECYPVVHSFYHFDYSTLFSFIFGVLFLVLLVGVWALYFIILREISRFLKRPFLKQDLRPACNIKRFSSRMNSALRTDPSASELGTGHHSSNLPRKTQNSGAKSFRSVGLILLSLTIGWLPIWILYFIYNISGQAIPSWIYSIFTWLMFVSYTVNPFLYCSNKQINQSVKRLICKSS